MNTDGACTDTNRHHSCHITMRSCPPRTTYVLFLVQQTAPLVPCKRVVGKSFGTLLSWVVVSPGCEVKLKLVINMEQFHMQLVRTLVSWRVGVKEIDLLQILQLSHQNSILQIVSRACIHSNCSV